jgi:hypothetical protein
MCFLNIKTFPWKSNKLTLIETRKSRDIQSDNNLEE